MPNDTKFILGTTLARFAVSWNFPLPSLIWPEGMRSSYGRGASIHVKAIQQLGCEYAISGDHRLKIVLQEGVEVRDLYRLAEEQQVQLRRLSYKRDSLEDIFLKAMENGYGGL